MRSQLFSQRPFTPAILPLIFLWRSRVSEIGHSIEFILKKFDVVAIEIIDKGARFLVEE